MHRTTEIEKLKSQSHWEIVIIAEENIYPNPANEFIFLDQLKQEIDAAEIMDLTGRLRYKINSITNKTISISQLEAGAYIIHLKFRNNESKSYKFIKI